MDLYGVAEDGMQDEGGREWMCGGGGGMQDGWGWGALVMGMCRGSSLSQRSLKNLGPSPQVFGGDEGTTIVLS